MSNKKYKILIVDDEPNILELVKFNLVQAGYDTREAATGLEALKIAGQGDTDLIVLDVMLPEIDGLEVCRHIRKNSNVPILMLSAKSDELDKVLGLEMGADDYLTKPFSPRELVARVKAILRRVEESSNDNKSSELKYRDLLLIPEEYRVLVKGEEIELTLTEYQILELLLKSPGRVFSREMLIESIWGENYFGDTRTVDVHIRHLREKIEQDPSNPEFIITVRGVGYKFKEKA